MSSTYFSAPPPNFSKLARILLTVSPLVPLLWYIAARYLVLKEHTELSPRSGNLALKCR